MTSPTGSRLRTLWLNLHLWIALLLGVLLVPVGLSGSALVWHDALDPLLEPQRYAVSGPEAGLAPSAYLTAAAEALGPDARMTALRLPAEPGAAVTVSARVAGAGAPQTMSVWLDPPTADVLDSGSFGDSLVGFLHRFHGSLALPQYNGRQIVGWSGAAMLISSLTGIWLWWPRQGLLRALGWRRGRRTSWNLHHMLGIWIAIPLAILSLTGIYLSFPQTGRATLGIVAPLSPATPRPQASPPLAGPRMSADDVLALVQEEEPAARLTSLSLPTEASPAWRLQLRGAAEGGAMTIMVDDATGAISRPAGPRAAPTTGDAIARWIRRLHDGAETGIVWQTVVFIGGLLPALLLVTGVMMWLRGRRNRRRIARQRAAAMAGAGGAE